MFFEIIISMKGFVTNIAMEIFDVFMNSSDVLFETYSLCIRFFADRAGILLDVFMDSSRVNSKIASGTKSLVTNMAMEFLDVFMQPFKMSR